MEKIALARLEMLNQIKLDDAQKDDVLAFFAKREEEVASLDQIDTCDVEPMIHAMPIASTLREDDIEQPFARDQLQALSSAIDAGYWCVPRVIEG